MLVHPHHLVVPSDLALRLVADHRRIEQALTICGDLLTRVAPARIASSWSDFERRLLAHLAAEEQTILLLLLETEPREARVLVAEHNHVRSRLAALSEALRVGTLRASDVMTFLHELLAHMRREEAALYAVAVERLDATGLRTLERALDALELH